jgi:hypothetical protein
MAKTIIREPRQSFKTIVLEVFKKSITPIKEQEAEEYADDIAERLRDRIRNNTFNFKYPIGPDQAARKEGIIPLIDTEQYINSISARKTSFGWIVGVEEGALHYPRGGGKPTPMIVIARSLEFGTRVGNRAEELGRSSEDQYMPPRPHWRPVHNEMRRERNLIQRKWTKRMNTEAQKAFKEYVSSYREHDINEN